MLDDYRSEITASKERLNIGKGLAPHYYDVKKQTYDYRKQNINVEAAFASAPQHI